MKEFQRNLNTTVIHNSKTDLGGYSNSNLLIFNVIVIAIYYIDLGSNCNSNSNILILKVIVIIIIIREYGSTLYVGMARKKNDRPYISIASDELKSLVILYR